MFSSILSGMPLKNLFSLTEPFGPPSPLAPLSETRTTMVLSSSPVCLEEVEQPADLVVGVAQEARVDLGHAREERFSSSDSESHGRTTSSGGQACHRRSSRRRTG